MPTDPALPPMPENATQIAADMVRRDYKWLTRLTDAVDAVLDYSFEDCDEDVQAALEAMRYENERIKRGVGLLPDRRKR